MNTLPQLRTGNTLLLIDPGGGYQSAKNITVTLALRDYVRVLDFGNRFDVNHLARPIRQHTPRVIKTLARVLITRPFSCYEATGALEAQADFITDGSHAPPAPLLLLDILSPYMDEAVNTVTAFGLLRTALACIQQIQDHTPILITARPAIYCRPERMGLFSLLCGITDNVIIIDEAITPIKQMTLWEAG